jgi:hypothetical protein
VSKRGRAEDALARQIFHDQLSAKVAEGEPQVMTPHRPPFASNNRMSGTPDENGAMSRGVVAYFGTYAVDESKHLLTLHIDQSSFPNWNGTDQRRVYAFIPDELRSTAEASTANPAESAELVWRRAR